MSLVGDLVEKAARATPVAAEDRRTCWWLRHTDNQTWWSGAAIHHGAADALHRRVEAAEKFYAEREAVTRFQICADCPHELDELLAQRGYRRTPPVSLQTAVADAQTGAQSPSAMAVCAHESLTAEWIDVLRVTSKPGTDVERETRLLRRVDVAQTYITVFAQGQPLGIGRAVSDDGWTGIFNMATVPQARRRGVGRLILSAIAFWACSRVKSRDVV